MDEVLTRERESSQSITKAFCVGQAKSGTGSLYSLLARSYRAAHEPERAETFKMILRQSEGEIDTDSFDDYLRQVASLQFKIINLTIRAWQSRATAPLIEDH